MSPHRQCEPTAPVVFVSYSRDDIDWLLRFQMMLKPLLRKGQLQLWSDSQVMASRTWRPEISAAIERAAADEKPTWRWLKRLGTLQSSRRTGSTSSCPTASRHPMGTRSAPHLPRFGFHHGAGASVTTPVEQGVTRQAADEIEARWRQLEAKLGQPLSPVILCDDGDGCRQDFEHGAIHWTAATGAWDTGGAIGARWRAIGAESGCLGYPLSSESACGDGDARYQTFQRGRIHWTAQTGAWETRGAIGARWQDLGAETGMLGFPLTGEAPYGDGKHRYQCFQRGSIHWAAATGAWETHGAIGNRWQGLGAENSSLGYPLSSEMPFANGADRYQAFEHGSISWSATSDTTTVHRHA